MASSHYETVLVSTRCVILTASNSQRQTHYVTNGADGELATTLCQKHDENVRLEHGTLAVSQSTRSVKTHCVMKNLCDGYTIAFRFSPTSSSCESSFENFFSALALPRLYSFSADGAADCAGGGGGDGTAPTSTENAAFFGGLDGAVTISVVPPEEGVPVVVRVGVVGVAVEDDGGGVNRRGLEDYNGVVA